MSDREILILRENLVESIVRDVFSMVSLTAVVAIGVVLQSEALQWVAAILWVISLLSVAWRWGTGKSVFTTDDARRRLDEMDASGK